MISITADRDGAVHVYVGLRISQQPLGLAADVVVFRETPRGRGRHLISQTSASSLGTCALRQRPPRRTLAASERE
jgi:hypothetical protein